MKRNLDSGNTPAVNHYNIRIKLAAILIAALLAFSCGGGGGGGGGAVTSWHKAESGGIHNSGDAGGWGSSPNPAPGFAPNNSGSSITSDEKLISQMAAIDNVTSIRLDLIVNGKPQQTIVADANTTKDVLPPIKPEDTVSGTAYIYVAGEESPRIAMLEETAAGLNKPLPFKVPYYYKAFDFSNTQVASGTYYTRDGINLAEFTPDGYGWKCRQDGSVHGGPFVSGVRGDIELELVDASGRPAPKLYVKADFDASSPTSYTIDETLAQDFAAGATPAAGSGSVIVTPLPAGTLYTETQSGNAVTSTGYHVTVTIDGTPFNINFIPSDTAAVPIINVPQGATITASASADITGGTGTTASIDLAGTASATMQAGGGTLTMYAKYPLTCQVSTAHMTNASISGTAPTFYTNTSPATALPTATAQYTNVSSGKIMRFIGWALQNNGTPVITGDTIPSTYKGALTLYACYDECSLTITGAALPATGSPVLASGDTLALTAVPEGFPAGQTITYSWRIVPPNYPLAACAAVSGSGANATVTPVAGASGSATVEVTATCGSLSASAMKNVTVVDLSVTGDTVIKKIDTGKMLTASLAGYSGSVIYSFELQAGACISLDGSGASRTITPVSGGKTTVRVKAETPEGTEIRKTVDVYVLNLVLGGSGLPANASDPIMLTDGSTETAALTASLEGISSGVTYSWSSSDTGVFTVSPSNTSATTITPVAAGSGTVTASLEYGGVTVQATRAVSVAGIQLTTCPDYFEKGATTGTSLMATLVGYSGSDVIWNPWTSQNTSVATLSGTSSITTWSQSTISPLAGGKTKITVTATAGGRTFSAEKEIYVFDLALSGGTSLSAPTPSNTNYGLMLTTADTAGKTITASLNGSGMPAVTYSWTCVDSALNTIIMDDSNSTSGTFTVKPRAAGTASFSVMATYNGTVVCSKTVDVAVAGLTLTGSGTHEFINASPVPTGANNIALTATLGGIASGALTPAGITFVSDDPTIATVTAGSASGSSRSATVTALKGGKVTITATATIAATNTVLSVTKEITIINIIVTDGSGTAVPDPADGNVSLADGPVVLTAEFEGLTTGVSYGWTCTPATGSNIGVSPVNGASTTVSGTLGTATVTLTAAYGGTNYTKNIGFDVIYCFALTDLSTGLAPITGTDAGNPVKIKLTAPLSSTADINTLKSALSSNSSVFVDLSEVTIAEGVNPVDLSYRSNLVVPPELPSTLIKLNLYGTGITDVSALSLPTGLQELNLSNCSGVTDWSGLSLPTGLQKLYLGSNPNLTSLAGVTLPSDLQELYLGESGVVSNLSALTIPDSVKKLSLAGSTLTSLTGLTLPASLTTSGFSYPFKDCDNLTDLTGLTGLTLPAAITDMSSWFRECDGFTNLDGVTIPNGVTKLDSCFQICKGLVDAGGLTIPSSVTSMFNCFAGCTSLTTAPVIPSSVSPGAYPHHQTLQGLFKGCTSLSGTITINAYTTSPTEYSVFSEAFDGVDPTKIDKIKVPNDATRTVLLYKYPAFDGKVFIPGEAGY